MYVKCKIEGCDGNAHKSARTSRGWCRRHYRIWLRTGDTKATLPEPGEVHAYINNVVLAYEGKECVIWPYSKKQAGYAQINIGGKPQGAYRYVCEKAHGPAPTPDHEAAHSCGMGNKGCVAKNHLRWATRKENLEDRLEHGTLVWGERCRFAVLTEESVKQIRSLQGTLGCRKLAERYGVSSGTILHIFNRRTWKHLE